MIHTSCFLLNYFALATTTDTQLLRALWWLTTKSPQNFHPAEAVESSHLLILTPHLTIYCCIFGSHTALMKSMHMSIALIILFHVLLLSPIFGAHLSELQSFQSSHFFKNRVYLAMFYKTNNELGDHFDTCAQCKIKKSSKTFYFLNISPRASSQFLEFKELICVQFYHTKSRDFLDTNIWLISKYPYCLSCLRKMQRKSYSQIQFNIYQIIWLN